jgi:hypothetical protein
MMLKSCSHCPFLVRFSHRPMTRVAIGVDNSVVAMGFIMADDPGRRGRVHALSTIT